MERCPPEILHRIFALACTDDGRTGRALSLVSTKIHDISSAYKYFSIHVTSLSQITPFATFLTQSYPHLAPRIQHLLLDCTIPGVEPGPIHAYNYNESLKAQQRSTKFFSFLSGDDEDGDGGHSAGVHAILRVLAPTLKGLYLVPGPAPIYLDTTTFPLLDCFYVYGDLYQTFINWDASTFPTLKRLLVSCNSDTHLGHGTILARIEIPTLTHLSSCAHRNSMGILVVLAALKATRQPPGWEDVLNNIKRLESMRVEVQSAPIGLLPELCEYSHTDELMEALKKTYPAIWGVPHLPMEEGVVPMEEWQYALEGGVGFLKAGERVQRESCYH